jgi:hypothetical protein
MAWEKRNGSLYYYRTVRDGEKVRKEYVGSGPYAELSARLDDVLREQRHLERLGGREKVARVEALAEPLRGVDEAAEVLARAHLVAAGYRRRKGEWRLRRE